MHSRINKYLFINLHPSQMVKRCKRVQKFTPRCWSIYLSPNWLFHLMMCVGERAPSRTVRGEGRVWMKWIWFTHMCCVSLQMLFFFIFLSVISSCQMVELNLKCRSFFSFLSRFACSLGNRKKKTDRRPTGMHICGHVCIKHLCGRDVSPFLNCKNRYQGAN